MTETQGTGTPASEPVTKNDRGNTWKPPVEGRLSGGTVLVDEQGVQVHAAAAGSVQLVSVTSMSSVMDPGCIAVFTEAVRQGNCTRHTAINTAKTLDDGTSYANIARQRLSVRATRCPTANPVSSTRCHRASRQLPGPAPHLKRNDERPTTRYPLPRGDLLFTARTKGRGQRRAPCHESRPSTDGSLV